MKSCQETEVQLQVIAFLNSLMKEAADLCLPADEARIRAAQLNIAYMRLHEFAIFKTEFWDQLRDEMQELKDGLSPRLLREYDPVVYLQGQIEQAKRTHLPLWAFAPVYPIEKWVFDWSKPVAT